MDDTGTEIRATFYSEPAAIMTGQTEPAPARTRSPSAERMRRLRERRRLGKVCFQFELDPWAISGLIELRWLPASRRDDHDSVVHAFHRFVAFALDMTRNTGRDASPLAEERDASEATSAQQSRPSVACRPRAHRCA
jgi:hypothetical protein